MRLFGLIADGGTDADDRHYECRECGRNLAADAEGCPGCGGAVAVYTF